MIKLTFIADTHYYSKTLGTKGRAYSLRSGSDQKCLAETAELIDAAFEKIAASDTSAVMIAGDLTNNGEMVSHIEFREKLYKLAEKKRVCVITATHDWCCDENPRRFCGNEVSHDVEVMPSDKLPEFYADFGPSAALSVFRTHIGTCSYVAQLSESVRLLALNDDKNENNHAGFTEEHFRWIEQQLSQAREDNCLVIGMEHHLLMPHISPLLTGGGACVEDREYVASRLADAGLKYMFVGHSHLQSTSDYTSENGNTIKEVNVGSLVGYPAPIVNVTVNDDMTLSYEVDHIDRVVIDGKEYDAVEYLRIHAVDLLHRLFNSPDRNEFADRLTALQGNGKKRSLLFPIAKVLFRHIMTDTVMDFCKRARLVGLGNMIDKNAVSKCKNMKLISIIDTVWLSLLDGGRRSFSADDDFYRLVMSFSSVPEKLFTKNENAKKLTAAMEAILTGGRYNNQKDTI